MMCPNCGSTAVERAALDDLDYHRVCTDCGWLFDDEDAQTEGTIGARNPVEDDPDFEGYPGDHWLDAKPRINDCQ